MDKLKDILQDMLGPSLLAQQVHAKIVDWIAKGNVQYKGKTFKQLDEELTECNVNLNIANHLLSDGDKPLIRVNRLLSKELKRIKRSSVCDKECMSYKK